MTEGREAGRAREALAERPDGGAIPPGPTGGEGEGAESGRARSSGLRISRIAVLDLAAFRRPRIPGDRGPVWRAAWYLVNAVLFDSALIGLAPSAWKAAVLRLFGAQVGRGLVCKPRVSIKYPWFVELGNHVWLGERVWIDNHCRVSIGSNCCISQGACIFTGNHDWNDPAFAFHCEPVILGEGVWVTAFCRLGPGTTVPAHTVVRA